VYSEKVCEELHCWDPAGAFALPKLWAKVPAAFKAAWDAARADRFGIPK
jgi:hypothetical protein